MMKHGKIRNSILSTVVALALLVSVISGLGIGTAAETSAESWDYSYAVTRNEDTSSDRNYYNAENLGEIVNDFKAYAWTVANNDYSASLPLGAGWESGKAISGNTVRQNANPTSGWRNAGYLDLQQASANLPVALTHNAVLAKNDEFLLEMDVVLADNWSVVKGIMIAPAGKFALVNSDTTPDEGVYIALVKGNTGIGGAIDTATASDLSTVTVGTSGGALAGSMIKNEENKIGGASYTYAADDTMLAVNGGTGNMLVTYCIKVQDGVLSVWEKNNPTKVLAVALSENYVGGSISFVSVSQNYNAFAGMRLKKLVKQTEWNYAVAQNTTDSNYTVDDFADIATDFRMYNWNIAAANGNAAYYAPTLTSGFPKAVSTSTVQVTPFYSEADTNTNQAARNFGYLDISSVASGTVSAMTHSETLAATDEFHLEMDFVVRNKVYSAAKALMIAPAGEFAVSNDGDAANDKGVYISFDSVGTLSVAGAVDTAALVTTDNAKSEVWGQQPFAGASHSFRSPSWFTVPETYTTTVTETNKAPVTYTAGIMTLCLEVRDGILTVWSKSAPEKAMSLSLTDAYAGGAISFVSTSVWDNAFAGMRLKKLDAMEEGTVAVNAETGIITVKGVSGKEIKNGSFVVTDKDGVSHVPTRVGFRYADNVLVYRVLDGSGNAVTNFDAADVKIAFVENTLDAPNIANYATSVNTEKSGLRFIARFNREKDESGNEYIVTADGTKYAVVDYGMLMAAGTTLDGEKTPDEEMVVDSANAYVRKISVKERNVYYDYCDAFNDMAVTVTGIGADNADLAIYARPYVVIENGGTTQVLYGNYAVSTYAQAGGV